MRKKQKVARRGGGMETQLTFSPTSSSIVIKEELNCQSFPCDDYLVATGIINGGIQSDTETCANKVT